VRTLRAAAQVLGDASSLDRLAPIAVAAGCSGTVSAIDDDTLAALGISATTAARIVDGPGALRALLLEVTGRPPLRDQLRRIASRLASRAPHVLWLVVATQPSTAQVGIAAWSAERSPPRVAALLADRERVVDSDAETLATLAAASDGCADTDVLTHTRWVEVLGREALTRRFYRALERRVAALGASLARGTEAERREVALLYCSRLLFLCFLEAKGWLNGDRSFLTHGFDDCMARGGGYHRRVLLPLFFGTLNTPTQARAPVAKALGRVPFLNGGLFSVAAAERHLRGACFPDEELGALFADVFNRYRFTAREERSDWVELAVDPEMLGRAFESLMDSGERKASGSFYTPHSLVTRLTTAGLARVVRIDPDTCHAASLGELSDITRRALHARLRDLTILDPACGSGAFLVHALERLAELHQYGGDERSLSTVRRDVLTRSIFGVDRNPTAVWLCELRLWLSVVIECDVADPLDVSPLPNLDRNVRVGDSLGGEGFAEPHPRSTGGRLGSLRDRYTRACGARKESLARQLDREERRLALAAVDGKVESLTATRRDLLSAMRGRDLFGDRKQPSADERDHAAALRTRLAALRNERRRLLGGGALPFSFTVHFADVASRGGFDLIIGNPPWVRLHRIPAAERDSLRARFRVFRAAAWEGGAARAQAGAGFAAQVDLSALFVERSLRLLRPGATLSLLVPVKLWRSLAGGGVRRLLTEESRIVELEDYSDAPAAFDAAVYPSLVVAERWTGQGTGNTPGEIAASAHRRGSGPLCWRIPRRTLALDDSPGSPWLVVPPDVRAAFDRLRLAGVALADSAVGRPHLGVKCGFNLAFLVRRIDTFGGEIATVIAANGRRGSVEGALLRPVIRGEAVRAWSPIDPTESLIWTHGPSGTPLDRLPEHASRWLTPWRHRLVARADAHGSRWWTLFRTEAARCDRPRVLWADLGRAPRATLLPAGNPTIPLNSCYVAICRDEPDALTLVAVLNSALARVWLAALAEPARGGYHRFLGWTVSLLPLPRNWPRAREILAPIAAAALHDRGDRREPGVDLLEACLEAYRLRRADVEPLLTWFAG